MLLTEHQNMNTGFIIHMILHVAIPIAVAWIFFRPTFKRAATLMLAGILIDVDHVLATPILDPNRCSVGYHLLHQYWLIPLYVGLALYPKTKWIGLGLIIHIVLDWVDCYL